MDTLSILVKAAQNGDAEAFEKIVERFKDMAYACAYSMLNDAQLAEDVAQEAFIEAYLELPKLREPAAFPGWFRRIVFKQYEAARNGNVTMVKLLLDYGAVLQTRTYNALNGAVQFNHREIVKLLVECGSDVNGILELSGAKRKHVIIRSIPLHVASMQHCKNVVGLWSRNLYTR